MERRDTNAFATLTAFTSVKSEPSPMQPSLVLGIAGPSGGTAAPSLFQQPRLPDLLASAALQTFHAEALLEEIKQRCQAVAGEIVRYCSAVGPAELRQATVDHSSVDPSSGTPQLSPVILQVMQLVWNAVGPHEALEQRKRLLIAEMEVDFLTGQIQRRDTVATAQRAELLREVQTSNELSRQYHAKYTELLEQVKSGGGGGTKRATPSAAMASVSLAVAPPVRTVDDEVSPPLRLTDAVSLGEKLETQWRKEAMQTEYLLTTRQLKAESDKKLKETQIRLRREHEVLVHRAVRRGEDALRTETMKLETKVKQLEQQLRRRDADGEVQLSKERERWKLQVQRAAETAKTAAVSRMSELLRRYECSRMECTEYWTQLCQSQWLLRDAQAEVTRLRAVLESQTNHQATSVSATTVSFAAAESGPLGIPSDLQLLSSDPHAHAGGRDSTPSRTSPETPGNRTPRLSRLQSRASVVESLVNLSHRPSVAGSTVSQHRRSRSSVNGLGRRGLRSGSVSVTTQQQSEELSTLRQQFDMLQKELAVTRLARDEALVERDALTDELTSSHTGAAGEVLFERLVAWRLGNPITNEDTMLTGSAPPPTLPDDPRARALWLFGRTWLASLSKESERLTHQIHRERQEFLQIMASKLRQRNKTITSLQQSELSEPSGGGGGVDENGNWTPGRRKQSSALSMRRESTASRGGGGESPRVPTGPPPPHVRLAENSPAALGGLGQALLVSIQSVRPPSAGRPASASRRLTSTSHLML